MIAKHCNRALAWIALVWGGLYWHPALANADDLCGNTNTPAVTQAESPTNGFRMVRIGNPGSLEYRDLEFAVDSLYTGLTSVQRQNVFSRWRIALTEQQASPSRVVIDANNFEALYDYFRLEGSNWNTNPNDTVSVRVGWITSKTADALPLSAYKPLDRAHVDVYLIHPSNPKRLDNLGGLCGTAFHRLHSGRLTKTSAASVGLMTHEEQIQSGSSARRRLRSST